MVAGKYSGNAYKDAEELAMLGVQIRAFRDGEVRYDNMDLDRMKGTAVELTKVGDVVEGHLDITAPQGGREGDMLLKGAFKATLAK